MIGTESDSVAIIEVPSELLHGKHRYSCFKRGKTIWRLSKRSHPLTTQSHTKPHNSPPSVDNEKRLGLSRLLIIDNLLNRTIRRLCEQSIKAGLAIERTTKTYERFKHIEKVLGCIYTKMQKVFWPAATKMTFFESRTTESEGIVRAQFTRAGGTV